MIIQTFKNYYVRIQQYYDKALPKIYRIPVLATLLSVLLQMIVVYQIEVIFIGATSGWGQFDFPFYWFSCSWQVARDFFYLLEVPQWLLCAWGFYQLGARVLINRLEKEEKKYGN